MSIVPKAKNKNVSNIMAGVRGKNTKPEIALRKALWANEVKGYRTHWKKVQGNPDIAFPSKKVAVFVNGCFWHRCPHCNMHTPQHNNSYWEKKFAQNIERDKNNYQALRGVGWTTLVIWECEIQYNLKEQVDKVKQLIKQHK